MTKRAFFEEAVLAPDIYRSTPFQYDLTATPSQRTETFGKRLLFGKQWDGKVMNLSPHPEPKPVRGAITLQSD